MKAKTSELIGSALNWAVSKCEGIEAKNIYGHVVPEFISKYSTDCAQAGPIIDREKISVWWSVEHSHWTAANLAWMCAEIDVLLLEMPDPYSGPTRLIAAMRCYVASKLGDEVEVPDELAS